ncbi:hypothetical protein BKA65DRAFT_86473 [Rhexocercosporidium sp. MPI-PUGE-AT-0058]|nr:hypothetical protein BKA65DRAFT_86473 [Rhexocercosporidium sp. MPI-PUGE-AT-0058]
MSMEFNTTRASFSFDAKSPGSDENLRRSKIVDPGSRELVVNAVSQAAASNCVRQGLAVTYIQDYRLDSEVYSSMNAQGGHGKVPVPLSLMTPVSNGSNRFPGPISSYETGQLEPSDISYSNVQIPTESGHAESICAIADPVPTFDIYSSKGYTLDDPNPCPVAPSFDAAFIQAAGCTNPMTTFLGNSSLDADLIAPISTYSFIGDGGFLFGHPGHATIPGAYISNQFEGGFTGIGDQAAYGLFSPSFVTGPASQLKSSTSPREPSLHQPQHRSFELNAEPLTVVNVSEAVDKVPLSLPPQNNLMTNFNSDPNRANPSTNKRPRKPFTQKGKTKVHGVRVKGACICCRSRKLSCSADDVCEGCLKLVSNPILALHICIRTKFKDDYLRVRDLHQSLDRRRARLEPLILSLTGLPISIQLCVTSEFGRGFGTAQLNLQVMRCTSSPFCRWKRLEMSKGIYVTSETTDDERYVIVPTSLPSIDEFDTFGREVLLMQGRSHSGAITWHLDRFLALYCSSIRPSRLGDLCNITSRIASLNKLVTYGFVNLFDGSFDLLNRPRGGAYNQRFVSETVHDQIRLLAAKGLEPAENLICSELDALKTIASASNHARIIAGICLLRLILVYRDRSVRDEIRISLPKNTNRHQVRLEKAASFYKRLTIAYSTLCREKDTPLTVEWEDEEDFRASEDAIALEEAYLQLQPVFKNFCAEYLYRQHDDVFEELIAKPLMAQDRRKKRKITR